VSDADESAHDHGHDASERKGHGRAGTSIRRNRTAGSPVLEIAVASGNSLTPSNGPVQRRTGLLRSLTLPRLDFVDALRLRCQHRYRFLSTRARRALTVRGRYAESDDRSLCKAKLLGCERLHANRGSVHVALRRKHAVPGADCARRHTIILDCGTGLRMLGNRRTSPSPSPSAESCSETHIFVTHYHWDHIQGIPFFAPFMQKTMNFSFTAFGRNSWAATV